MAKKTTALQKQRDNELRTISPAESQHQLDNSKRIKRIDSPPVDIIESSDEVLIIADMPGVTDDQLNVSVDKSILTISGLRELPRVQQFERTGDEYTLIHYHRQFKLGNDLELDQVEAVYQDGVLRVVLPKKDHAKPRRIEIKSG